MNKVYERMTLSLIEIRQDESLADSLMFAAPIAAAHGVTTYKGLEALLKRKGKKAHKSEFIKKLRAKVKEKQKGLEEARMTRKQLGDEASELLGDREKPSGIVSGKGYNFPRARKEFRRAERRGADKVTNKDMKNMSATGVAQKVGQHGGILSKATGLNMMGKRILKGRARAQAHLRGYEQDTKGMENQMKKNPDAFAPPTKLSRDPTNPYHDKETMIGGRTRQATHRLAHGKPMDMLTIPSQRHAGSAKRHSKWVASGGRDKMRATLAKQGKHLRGQDPRL